MISYGSIMFISMNLSFKFYHREMFVFIQLMPDEQIVMLQFVARDMSNIWCLTQCFRSLWVSHLYWHRLLADKTKNILSIYSTLSLPNPLNKTWGFRWSMYQHTRCHCFLVCLTQLFTFKVDGPVELSECPLRHVQLSCLCNIWHKTTASGEFS